MFQPQDGASALVDGIEGGGVITAESIERGKVSTGVRSEVALATCSQQTKHVFILTKCFLNHTFFSNFMHVSILTTCFLNHTFFSSI